MQKNAKIIWSITKLIVYLHRIPGFVKILKMLQLSLVQFLCWLRESDCSPSFFLPSIGDFPKTLFAGFPPAILHLPLLGVPPDPILSLSSARRKELKEASTYPKSFPIWKDLTENHGRPLIFRVHLGKIDHQRSILVFYRLRTLEDAQRRSNEKSKGVNTFRTFRAP